MFNFLSIDFYFKLDPSDHDLNLHHQILPHLFKLFLAKWFLRRSFFKITNKSSIYHDYPPLKEGVVHYFDKREFPSHNDVLCQVGLKLARWFWKKSRKCYFFLLTNRQKERQTYRRTDKRMLNKKWLEKLTWVQLKWINTVRSQIVQCSLILQFLFIDFIRNWK